MRIISWNLAHQTQERPIHPQFLEAVKLLSPDVLVLNEYVHGKSRTEMMAGLAQLGLGTIHVSDQVAGQNQVLIASQAGFAVGDDLPGPTTTPAATSNFLHVIGPDIEIVGMRAPAYKQPEQLAEYWQEIEMLITRTATRRVVFIGDMNCNPERVQFPGGRVLKRLHEAGWHVPSPDGEWSFISKNGTTTARIDHVIASPMFTNVTAEYVICINGIILAGKTSDNAISDHAALVVEVEV